MFYRYQIYDNFQLFTRSGLTQTSIKFKFQLNLKYRLILYIFQVILRVN